MKRVQVALCFVFLFFLTTSHAVDLKQSVSDLKSFDYNSSTDFSQVGDIVRDEMVGERSSIQGDLQKVHSEFTKNWTQGNPSPINPINSSIPAQIANNTPEMQAYYAKYNEALKAELKEKALPMFQNRIENSLRGKMGGDGGKGQEYLNKMMDNVKDKAAANFEKLVNEAVDKAGKTPGGAINMANTPEGMPMSPMFSLAGNLAMSSGQATTDGLKEFVDNEVKRGFGIDSTIDVAKFVNDKVHNTGDILDDVADQLGFSDEVGKAKEIMGSMSADGLQNKIGEILKESGLPNVYNLNPSDYFSASKAMDAINNAAGINLPEIRFPAQAHAAIQIASGVRHILQGLAPLPWYINWPEIEKGQNCIDTAQWTLSKALKHFQVIGGRLGLADLGSMAAGYAAEYANIDSKTLNDLKEVSDKIKNLNPKDLIASKIGLNEAIGKLGEIKTKLDENIAKAKGAVTDKLGDLADKTGVSDAIDKVKETKDKVKEKINEAKENLKEKAKDMLPEKGKYFVDAKPTMESSVADKQSGIDPIILYSGEFVTESTDLKVKSIGIDFEFKRYYRSQRERDSLIGYNWSFNFDQKIIRNGDDVLYQDEAGQIYAFKKKDEVFEAPYQLTSTLLKTEAGYKLLERDGTTKQFDNDGLLIKISDRHNNSMTFEYAGTKEIKYLKYIVDTQGRRYTLRYEDGKLSSLTDPFEREVKYTHDKHDNLASVRTPITSDYPQGKVTRYNYSGGNIEERLNHNLTMIMDPKGQVYLKNTYGEEGTVKDRLVAQQYGGEKAPMMTVQYEIVNPKAKDMNEVATKTITTDRLGKKEIYEHNAFGLRLSADGFAYTYDDKGRVTYECRGELPFARINSKCTVYSYDDNNIKTKMTVGLAPANALGSDGTVVETHYAYGPFNQLKEKTVMSSYKCDVGLTNCTTGPLQQRTVAYEFDSKGNIAKKIDGDSITTYSYNELGQVIKEGRRFLSSSGEDPRIQNFTSYFYDGALVTKITEIPQTPFIKGGSREATGGFLATSISYNKFGFVESITDPNGNTTKYWANELGQIKQKRDPLATTTVYEYDANDNLTAVKIACPSRSVGADATNTIISEKRFEYDVYDNMVAQYAATGQGMSFQRKLESSSDSGNIIVSHLYTYDPSERLTKIVQPNGVTREFTYNDKNWLLSEKLNGQVQFTREYNDDGDIISETDGLNNKRSWNRDGLGRVVSYTDARGTTVNLEYTGFGEVAGYNVGADPRVRPNFILGQTQGSVPTNAVKYTYDTIGRITKETKSSGDEMRTIEREYANGRLSQIKDAQGVIAKYVYDEFGRLAQTTDADGNTITLAYDLNGNVVEKQVTGQNSNFVGANGVRPNSGQPHRAAPTNVVKYTFDVLNRKIAETDGAGNTTKWEYDSLNNVIAEIDAMGNTTNYEYDVAGKLLKETRGNRVRTFEYDNKQNLVALIDGDNQKTEYKYDEFARLKTKVEPDGVVHNYTYDVLGRLVQKKVADTEYKFAYDPNGNMISKESNGYKQTFAYDPMNRIVESFDSNDPSTKDDDVIVKMEYNGFNQLIAEAVNDKAVKYAYDVRGNNTSMTYPSGMMVEKQFTAGGLVSEINVANNLPRGGVQNVVDADSSGVVVAQSLAKFDYAVMGLKKSEQFANGTTKEYNYNNMMQLINEKTNVAGISRASLPRGGVRNVVDVDSSGVANRAISAPIFDYTYTYDNLGRIAAAHDLREKSWKAYEYNELGQLTQSLVNTKIPATSDQQPATTYSLTPEGDLMTASLPDSSGAAKQASLAMSSSDEDPRIHGLIEISSGHRYSKFAGKEIKYDNRGNLINDGTNEYKYDPWNRLTQVTNHLSPVTVYSYDSFNRRISKSGVNVLSSSGATSLSSSGPDPRIQNSSDAPQRITYIYSHYNVVEEYTNDTLSQQYINGDGIDNAVAFIKDGQKYFYHKDRLNNVVAISDETGNVVERYNYGAYGELTVIASEAPTLREGQARQSSNELTHSSIGNTITYTGQRYDSESGLYYYKNRYYSSTLGRFLTKDPLNMIDGPNLYAYVNNDPVNWIDPLGTQSAKDCPIKCANKISSEYDKVLRNLEKELKFVKGEIGALEKFSNELREQEVDPLTTEINRLQRIYDKAYAVTESLEKQYIFQATAGTVLTSDTAFAADLFEKYQQAENELGKLNSKINQRKSELKKYQKQYDYYQTELLGYKKDKNDIEEAIRNIKNGRNNEIIDKCKKN